MMILLKVETDPVIQHDRLSDKQLTIQEAAAYLQWNLRRITFVSNVEIVEPAMPGMDATVDTPETRES